MYDECVAYPARDRRCSVLSAYHVPSSAEYLAHQFCASLVILGCVEPHGCRSGMDQFACMAGRDVLLSRPQGALPLHGPANLPEGGTICINIMWPFPPVLLPLSDSHLMCLPSFRAFADVICRLIDNRMCLVCLWCLTNNAQAEVAGPAPH